MTRNRTLTALIIAVAIGLIGGIGPSASNAADDPPRMATTQMTIRNHTDNQQPAEIVEWTLSRYESAGIQLPGSEIHFHSFEPSMAECNGRGGLHLPTVTDAGVQHLIDICAVGVPSRRQLMLHEFAHAWAYYNMPEGDREAFVAERALETWSEKAYDWDARAAEHAAEILAWGLDERCTARHMLTTEDPADLAAAFEGLTGTAPLCK